MLVIVNATHGRNDLQMMVAGRHLTLIFERVLIYLSSMPRVSNLYLNLDNPDCVTLPVSPFLPCLSVLSPIHVALSHSRDSSMWLCPRLETADHYNGIHFCERFAIMGFIQ